MYYNNTLSHRFSQSLGRPEQRYIENLFLPQAIEDGLLDALKKAVQEMVQTTDTLDCLNVCEMVPGRNPRLYYAMTLLAFAGFYRRSDMLEYLVSQGARK